MSLGMYQNGFPLYYRICCHKITGEMLCDGNNEFGVVKKQIERHTNDWIFIPNEYFLINSAKNFFKSCAFYFIVQKN